MLSAGDWIKLVDSEKEYYNIPFSDEVIAERTGEKYKYVVKSQVKERALEDLKNIQNVHSKVKNIIFENINKPQEYLTSKVFNNKTSNI